jgi:hypothetical protein
MSAARDIHRIAKLREPTMRRVTLIALGALGAALTGCQTDAQILAKEQEVATQTALRRGQFELNCPQATASQLSSAMLQPIAWRGTERAEYTIGVAGCGRQKTYVVVCPLDSSACYAVSGR